jgi:hypothetical protein
MARRRARLFYGVAIGALAAALGACEHHDAAMHGNADGVMISYAGDINETLPIARQHCGQYERIPVLRTIRDDAAIYACIRVNAAP